MEKLPFAFEEKSLGTYLKEIARVPLLTPQEEKQLSREAHKGDEKALADIPESLFKVGTAEIKNWYPVIAAMNETDLGYHLVDYIPCYRSEAGTGNAMAFVYWD